MNHILDDLTPQQRAAATKTGPTLVIAGAGTGKTKTLTAAVADRIIEHRISPSRIIAVTFTNKAAGEMTGRIRKLRSGTRCRRVGSAPSTDLEPVSSASSRKWLIFARASTSSMPTTAGGSSSGS